MGSKREYGLVLLAGAVGGGLVLVSVRQRWAQAVFTPPKPLSAQTISVTGTDLVPLAGAPGIATRGGVRRAAGVLLAAFGTGVAVAAGTAVSAASVLSAAASHAGAPGAAAISGAAGSATGGTPSG